MMWGRGGRRGSDRSAELKTALEVGALVRECESFLDGRYATELARARRTVPGWAWLSALAHSPASRLVAWAGSSDVNLRTGEEEGDEWRAAVSMLSARLLATAAAMDCDVEDLQRSVLVPLELDVGRLRSVGGDTAQLLGEVLRGIDAYRNSPRS